MDKYEILEKNRKDNERLDERFKLIEQRTTYAVLTVMVSGFVLLFLWDFFHGRETGGMIAVFLSCSAALGLTQFYRFRMKGALFLGVLAALGAVSFAANYVAATM